MALCRGLGGGQGLPATRGLSPSVSPLPPSWGGGVHVRGALAGLEVEGRILLTAPTPCDLHSVTSLCCPAVGRKVPQPASSSSSSSFHHPQE